MLSPLNLPLVENFLAQSWDLNIIEDVWAILKAKVNVRGAWQAVGGGREGRSMAEEAQQQGEVGFWDPCVRC